MLNNNPLVSIVSPCYNGEKYLNIYLDSILNQTYSNIELIIVDDASMDNSLDIINSYIEKFEQRGYKLICIVQSENKGQAAAINVALPLVSGEYMMWMDSDDYFYPEAIEKKLGIMLMNPNIDFCLCEGDIVNEKNLNQTIGKLRRKKPIVKDDFFSDLIYTKNVVFGPGTIFVKMDSLKRVIPTLHIYEGREGQNWQLMLPLAYSCKFDYIEESLFKYIVHGDSHSHMRRTYIDQIKREENFIVLKENTIDNIVDMSEAEKSFWKKASFWFHKRRELQISSSNHKFKEFLSIKKLLKKQGVKISIKESYLLNSMRGYLSSIKFFIKTRINRESA